MSHSTALDQVSVAVTAGQLTRARPRTAAHLHAATWELLLVGSLLVLAALVRWPDFLYVPVFTDEAYDAVRSALVAQGQLQTPVNSSPYIGSVQNYLTAALFWLLGPEVYVPRLLVLIVGCLTVVAAYLLAREWGGPLAGALAGALVATNPVHVLVNSHIAWSNCLTPFFTTLGFWQLTRAVRRSDGPALARCAVLLALALLTHPAAILVLPACAVYLVWKAPGLLRTRWLWISAGLFALVYSPVVLYYLFARFYPEQFAEQLRASHPDTRAFGPGLASEGDPLQFAVQVRESHTVGGDYGPARFVRNLPGFALLLLRSTSAAIDPRSSPRDYLLDPAVLLWLLLGLAAVLVLARRGEPLPLLVLVGSLLLAPLWSVKRFEPISHGRYFMPTVIALYAAVAVAAPRLLSATRPGRPTRTIVAALVGLAGLALAVQPLVDLGRFYDTRPADNRSSIEALAAIEAAREPGELVVLDRRLDDRRLGEGAVELDQTLIMLLRIRGIPYREADMEPDDVQALLTARPSQLVVLDRYHIPRLSERYALTPLALLAPRLGRSDRQHDLAPAWREMPLAPLLRQLDPQKGPERRDARACLDCADPGVYRVAPKG